MCSRPKTPKAADDKALPVLRNPYLDSHNPVEARRSSVQGLVIKRGVDPAEASKNNPTSNPNETIVHGYAGTNLELLNSKEKKAYAIQTQNPTTTTGRYAKKLHLQKSTIDAKYGFNIDFG